MALKVGDLYVSLAANTTQFTRSLTSVVKSVEATAKQIRFLAKDIAEISAPFAIGVAGAIAAAAQLEPAVGREVDKVKALMQRMAADIGEMFLPTIKEMSKVISGIITQFRALDPALKAQVAGWMMTGAQVSIAMVALMKLSATLQSLSGLMLRVIKIVGGISAPMVALVAAVAGVIAVSAWLYKAWNENWGGIQEKTGSVVDFIGKVFKSLGTNILKALSFVVKNYTSMLMGLLKSAAWVFEKLGVDTRDALEFGSDMKNWADQIFTPEGVASMWESAKDLGVTVGEALGVGLRDTGDAIADMFGDIMKKLGLDKHIAKMRELWGAVQQGGDVALDQEVEFGKRGPARTKLPAYKQILGPKQRPEFVFNDLWVTLGRASKAVGVLVGKAFVKAGGLLAETATAVMEGFSKGGVMGGVIQGLVQLLTSSKGFQRASDEVNRGLQQVSDVLGMVFEALMPLIQVLNDIAYAAVRPLGAVLVALGGVFKIVAALLTALTPVFDALNIPLRALFEVVRVLGIVVGRIVQGIAWVWNGIVEALASVFDWIAGFELFGARPFAFLDDWGDGIRNAKLQTDGLREAISELENLTWDQSLAQVDATRSANELAKSAQKASSELLNLPSGFRVAMARFSASDPTTFAPRVPVEPTTGAGGNGRGDGAQNNGGGDTYNFIIGDDKAKSGRQLATEAMIELKRRRYQQTGNPTMGGGWATP